MAGNTVNTKRLSLKPENLECNIFLNYNLQSLCVASRGDVEEVPENFVAPNSTITELLPTVSSTETGTEPDDELNAEIVISSDERMKMKSLDSE